MANITTTPNSSIVFIARTIRPGNADATERVIGPKETGGGGGGGSIPTEGIIWWPKK